MTEAIGGYKQPPAVERGSSWPPVQPDGIDDDGDAKPRDDYYGPPAANIPGALGVMVETSIGFTGVSLFLSANFLDSGSHGWTAAERCPPMSVSSGTCAGVKTCAANS